MVLYVIIILDILYLAEFVPKLPSDRIVELVPLHVIAETFT